MKQVALSGASGYSLLFAVLAAFNILGAIVVFALARRTDAEVDDGLPATAPSGAPSRV